MTERAVTAPIKNVLEFYAAAEGTAGEVGGLLGCFDIVTSISALGPPMRTLHPLTIAMSHARQRQINILRPLLKLVPFGFEQEPPAQFTPIIVLIG